MTNLRQLQEQFQDYLLDVSTVMLTSVVDTKQVSAQTRMDIYHYAYAARLLEVLELDFSALHSLLGDEGFHQLGHAYLRAYPSCYRSVRWFAKDLPDFLRNTEPYWQHPVLAEMADFEWALQHVLDAEDTNPLTIADIAALKPEQWGEMQLSLHPAVQRLNFHWNIVAIWQAVEDQQEIPSPVAAEFPVPWLLWRSQQLQVLFHSLPVEEAWALDAVQEGQSFGEICEGLCEWVDEQHAGLHAASLLKGWVEQGIIVGVSL